MIQDHQLSERHACRLVGLSRDSYRNPPQPDQLTRDLCERIVDIAHVRRRFGYRRIHDLLRPEFPHVNHKRVYRLYRDANLAVRRRKKAKRPLNERVPLQLAQTVNEVWSMDFVSDSLSSGRRIKCLTGSRHCHRPEHASLSGAGTTTKSSHTAAWVGYHRLYSGNSIELIQMLLQIQTIKFWNNLDPSD